MILSLYRQFSYVFFDNAMAAYYPDVRNQFIHSTISESLNSLMPKFLNSKSHHFPWNIGLLFSKAFGSTPGAWIRLQAVYDTAQASTWADEIHVERYVPAAAG